MKFNYLKAGDCNTPHNKLLNINDIMTTLYSLYIGGLNGDLAEYKFGVNSPYQHSQSILSPDFPYLAKAEHAKGLGAFFKRLILNTVLKLRSFQD